MATPVHPSEQRHELEHRARRLGLVVAALRQHAGSAPPGHVPPALHRAMADFQTELANVRRRLGHRHRISP